MWCPTDENPSDLLTKAIASPSKFAKFQSVLLGECEAKQQVVTRQNWPAGDPGWTVIAVSVVPTA